MLFILHCMYLLQNQLYATKSMLSIKVCLHRLVPLLKSFQQAPKLLQLPNKELFANSLFCIVLLLWPIECNLHQYFFTFYIWHNIIYLLKLIFAFNCFTFYMKSHLTDKTNVVFYDKVFFNNLVEKNIDFVTNSNKNRLDPDLIEITTNLWKYI